MQITKVLLVLFVVLSIVFASSAHGQVTTLTTTSTTTETGTTVMTTTVTSGGPVPTNVSLLYLSNSGICSGPGGPEPCWGNTDAYVFDCASTAATPQGCTQVVISTLSSSASFNINIRYPFANQTTQEINQLQPSLVNCLWTVQGDVPQVQGYANCMSISSTSFIIGIPAGPTD